MLEKNFIKKNTSHYATSMFIIKKFDEKFRVCVDYKTLNVLIIKNRNAFSLIKKTLIKLCLIKIYNKFDIIATFNEIKKKRTQNDVFHQIRIIRIRNNVFWFLQRIRHFLIFHKFYVTRIFERFLYKLFERYFHLQQQ